MKCHFFGNMPCDKVMGPAIVTEKINLFKFGIHFQGHTDIAGDILALEHPFESCRIESSLQPEIIYAAENYRHSGKQAVPAMHEKRQGIIIGSVYGVRMETAKFLLQIIGEKFLVIGIEDVALGIQVFGKKGKGML